MLYFYVEGATMLLFSVVTVLIGNRYFPMDIGIRLLASIAIIPKNVFVEVFFAVLW